MRTLIQILILIFFISACSQTNNNKVQNAENPQKISFENNPLWKSLDEPFHLIAKDIVHPELADFIILF